MAEAQAHPDQLFSVIVQGKPRDEELLGGAAVVESIGREAG